MRLLIALTAALLLAHAAPAWAQRDYVDIEKRLSAGQLKATGLDQLSREQLALLNSLLSEEQDIVVKAAKVESERSVLGTWFGSEGKQPIASTLVGDFRGWTPATTFTLENGQRWRVLEGSYHVGKPTPGAKVLVAPGKISGWYLQVDGHNPRAKVRLLD